MHLYKELLSEFLHKLTVADEHVMLCHLSDEEQDIVNHIREARNLLIDAHNAIDNLKQNGCSSEVTLPAGEYTIRIEELPGQVNGFPVFWCIHRVAAHGELVGNYGHGWSVSYDDAVKESRKWLASCNVGGK